MLQVERVKQLDLGIRGENNARMIRIDCAAWAQMYPDGAFSILHKRAGDSAGSVTGASFDRESGMLEWTLTGTDTFYAGEGQAEIRVTEGEIVKKSVTIRTVVHESIVNDAGQAVASDWESYIGEVERLKSEAVGAVSGAAEAAETLMEAVEDALEDAAQAIEDSAGAAETAAEAKETAEATLDEAQDALTDAQAAAVAAAALLARTDAVVGITREGTTFTATLSNGETFTFTQQDNDTKNTAGATDSGSKLFLIGATSQGANPQTYSQDTAWIGTDGCLYSGGQKVLTEHQDISGKADKVSGATSNNFAALDSSGNLKDSGHKHSDYLTEHQDISGKANDDAVVHLTGNETVNGKKTFTSDIRMTVETRQKKLYFKHNEESNGISCNIEVNAGHNTNQTVNQMSFVEYSPKTTAATDNTGYAERYFLPEPDKGLEGDENYDIYTEKNLKSLAAENDGTDVSLVTTGQKYNWNNTVKLTGDQSVQGTKTFREHPIIRTNSRYKYIYFLENTAENGTSGFICCDAGNVTNQTSNRMYFGLYSPKTTEDPANTGKAERYYLPAPTKGISDSVSYNIMTTKDYLPLDVDFGTISGTGTSVTITKSVPGAEENMRPVYVELGTPSAVLSSISITPGADSCTVTMTVENGSSTTVRFVLQRVKEVTAS